MWECHVKDVKGDADHALQHVLPITFFIYLKCSIFTYSQMVGWHNFYITLLACGHYVLQAYRDFWDVTLCSLVEVYSYFHIILLSRVQVPQNISTLQSGYMIPQWRRKKSSVTTLRTQNLQFYILMHKILCANGLKKWRDITPHYRLKRSFNGQQVP